MYDRPLSLTEDQAPEVAKVWNFPDDPGPVSGEIPYRELGLAPKTHFYLNTYRHPRPDRLQLLELRDVPAAHGVVFSKSGRIFVHSARWQETYLRPGFDRRPGLSPVGNGYFALARPAENDFFEEPLPAVLFFTRPQFGHFFWETLPLLWLVEEGFRPTLILHPDLPAPPAYLPDLLAPFGLGEKDWKINPPLGLYRRLYLPQKPSMVGKVFSRRARGVFARIAEYYADGRPVPEKIYLSRRDAPGRPLVNEDECEEIFRARGFAIIRPERLSLSEQVRLWAGARYAAGPVGSALHLAAFARASSLKLLILSPDFPALRNFVLMEAASGRRPEVAFGSYLTPNLDRLSRYGAVWTLPPANLNAALDQWLND